MTGRLLEGRMVPPIRHHPPLDSNSSLVHVKAGAAD